MTLSGFKLPWVVLTMGVTLISGFTLAYAQQTPPSGATSYMPVDLKEAFATVMACMKAAQPEIQKRQADWLAERYDLANRSAAGVTMSRSKPIQEGIRVRLPAGTSWDQLAGMAPTEIRDRSLFPKGFHPLPHPNHPEGGMLFPKFEIEELKKQEARDLTRFDLDFDIPDQFLPEFRRRYI